MSAIGILAESLEALTDELRADGTDADLCARTVFGGSAVPLDFGECGGMAWVRLASAVPSASFPTPTTSVDNCAYSLALTVEMGVARPAPMGEQGINGYQPPTEDEEFESAQSQMLDMDAMHRALVALRRAHDLMVLGSYAPLGPEGGVVGGVWTFTIGEED